MLQDAFIKLVDATIQASGRSGDGLRRSTNEMQIPLTPLLETPGNDAMEASIMSEKAAPQTGAGYVDGSKDVSSGSVRRGKDVKSDSVQSPTSSHHSLRILSSQTSACSLWTTIN